MDSKRKKESPKASKPRNLKTRYSKTMIEIAARAARAGPTEREISELLGCHITTYYRWKYSHPEFDQAICDARLPEGHGEALERLEQVAKLTEDWFMQWLKDQGAIKEKLVYANGLSGDYIRYKQGGPPDIKLIREMMDSGSTQDDFRVVIEVATPPADDIDDEDEWADWDGSEDAEGSEDDDGEPGGAELTGDSEDAEDTL